MQSEDEKIARRYNDVNNAYRAKFKREIPIAMNAGGWGLTTELWYIERVEEAVKTGNPEIYIDDHLSNPETDA